MEDSNHDLGFELRTLAVDKDSLMSVPAYLFNLVPQSLTSNLAFGAGTVAGIGLLGPLGVIGGPIGLALKRGLLNHDEIDQRFLEKAKDFLNIENLRKEGLKAESKSGQTLWKAAKLNEKPMRSCAKQDEVLNSSEDSFCGIGRDVCAITEALLRDILLSDLSQSVIDVALKHTSNARYARRAPIEPERASLGQIIAWVAALENAVEADVEEVVDYLRKRVGVFESFMVDHALSRTLNAISEPRNSLAHGRMVDNEVVFHVCETLLGRTRVSEWWKYGEGEQSPLVRMLAARAAVLEGFQRTKMESQL